MKLFFNKLFVAAFVFLLSSALTGLAFYVHLKDRQQVKDWLNEAKVYESLPGALVDTIYSQVKEEPGGADIEDLGGLVNSSLVSQDDIKGVAERTYDPAFWRTQIESVIDGIYDVAEGKKDNFLVTFDFNQKKDEAVAHVNALLKEKVAALPPCTPEQTRAIGTQVDLLDIDCLPPGVNPNTAVDLYTRDIAGELDIKNQEVKAEDVLQSDQAPSSLRGAFSGLRTGMIVLAVLAALLGAAIVLTGRDISHGLRVLATSFISAGVAVAIGALIFLGIRNLLLDSIKNQSPDVSTGKVLVDTIVTPLYNAIVSDIGRTALIVSGASAALGVAILIGRRFIPGSGAPAVAGVPERTETPAKAEPTKAPEPVKDDSKNNNA